jgi:hypothetical protein
MIIPQIIGGLGNQMFQYAMARKISLEKGYVLKLDVSKFKNYSLHHGYELNRIFPINTEAATDQNLRDILGWQSSPLGQRIVLRKSLSWLRCKNFIIEHSFAYTEAIANALESSYFVGYWQSERYFLSSAPTIRSDFSFKLPLSEENATMKHLIDSCNAVSLHVRRGDYVGNKNTLAIHGVCENQYYFKALEYIKSRVHNPKLFVFSDDLNWVKNNISTDIPMHYVECNTGAESYNDMRLMSMCKHHIIANSSFSWWGAWLNPLSTKIVIAPNKWFRVPIDTRDLIPNSWIRL